MTTPSLPIGRPGSNAGSLASVPNESPARRWLGGKSDPVARHAAARIGMRPASVEQLMKSVNHRCAAIIEAFHALGDDVRLVKFLAPIDAALAKVQHPDFTPTLVREEAEADAGEDVAECALLVAPSREAALLFIRRSQAARAAALRLELAVAKRWQIWT